MTAIRATFSDFRTVKSRKVAQLVMEVPIEDADAALRTLGGVPRPDVDRWVGIAPITEEASRRPAEKPATARTWADLTYSQQAGIRCNEPTFQEWMNSTDADHAAKAVRQVCGVASRAELDQDRVAGTRWRDLDAAFRDFCRNEAPA